MQTSTIHKKWQILTLLAFLLLFLSSFPMYAYAVRDHKSSSVPAEEKKEEKKEDKAEEKAEGKEGSDSPGKEEEPPPKPVNLFLMPSDDLVKGFHGEARTLAKQWFQKQKYFDSIEYIPGSQGKFWDKGTLVGKMKKGGEVSLEIPNDFSRDNPDMIIDHLRVLEFRADISGFSRQEWKKYMVETRVLQKKIEQANAEFDKRIERIIRKRLLRHMKDQLSSAGRGTIEDARSELEVILTPKVTQQIEAEVKRKFPKASDTKIAEETGKRVESQLESRLKKMVDDYILDEKLSYDGIQGEARTVVHNFMLKYKKPIVAKVKKDYGPLRRKEMSELIGKIEKEKEKRKQEEASILGQMNKQFQSIKTNLMGLLPFGNKTAASPPTPTLTPAG